jgi:predicted mannosyl-3-phosphoglycerate phosphatase (HAD superfamily)
MEFAQQYRIYDILSLAVPQALRSLRGVGYDLYDAAAFVEFHAATAAVARLITGLTQARV